jgi:hypothetical protein
MSRLEQQCTIRWLWKMHHTASIQIQPVKHSNCSGTGPGAGPFGHRTFYLILFPLTLYTLHRYQGLMVWDFFPLKLLKVKKNALTCDYSFNGIKAISIAL